MKAPRLERLRLEIRGAVQGVGFRPFVYRLANELGLSGWVSNDARGVLVEVDGAETGLEAFLERLRTERPPRSVVHSVQTTRLPAAGYEGFHIRPSDDAGGKTAAVLPDVATCGECLAEVLDSGDRRYRYPFANCTNCGPRFTIVEALPYDRSSTTMRRFGMCPRCSAEYEEPSNRRFHAQPNACPVCGPRLALWDREGSVLAEGDEALRRAAAALANGEVLAAKGLGGFHLMVDARDEAAVERLRRRKGRPHKALALMVADLRTAGRLCEVSREAETLLQSPEAPILLLRRRAGAPVARGVAPDNPYLGVMLPYSPLHHLLLREVEFPLVATSGNLTDEPICTDEREALERLGGIADMFLVHDRPIARHVDDSVAWLHQDEPRLLRRARGHAPLPLLMRRPLPTILAVGAHFKNTVALAVGDQVFLSQHIGDMETAQALEAFERVVVDFLRLYEAEPVAVAHDLHPDYASTRWAEELATRPPPRGADHGERWRSILAAAHRVAVQHHHAHLAACLAENGIEGPALGVIWDGTGYGSDATVWGGEFLIGDAAGFDRVARLRRFRLPGGDAAVREPRRAALALLWELAGEAVLERGELAPVASLSATERRLLARMLERGLRSPITSSAGRLFDGVAALVGLRQRVSFEAQAAMELEFVADRRVEDAYPVTVERATPSEPVDGRSPPGGAGAGSHPLLEVNWGPLVEAVVEDVRRGAGAPIVSARFHNALAEAIVAVAREIGQRRVALSGGCFQNRLLSERASQRLRDAGFEVLLHRRVPPNDGGISLGQVAVAAARSAAAEP